MVLDNLTLSREVVDLSLPSGNLWCTCNLGGASPTDFGYFYQALTNAYRVYPIERDEDGTYTLKPIREEGVVAASFSNIPFSPSTLPFICDDPSKMLDKSFSTPTEEDFVELTSNTTFGGIFSTKEGYKHVKLISKANGNEIIFPLCGYGDPLSTTTTLGDFNRQGYYWTKTLTNDFKKLLTFKVSDTSFQRYDPYWLQSIRPILKIDANGNIPKKNI